MSDFIYRTPDARFAEVPDFSYQPHYRELDGVRLAHIDEGQGAPIVFVHGEPTWSFLWRHVMAPALDAGYRCIAPDHAGFGRSDKPTELDWYSYDRHTANLVALLDDLDLRGVTMVVHDWGGPIGLRAAVERPERVERLVAMDTGLFTGEQPMSDAWLAFRDFVERTEDLPIGLLVERATARGLAPEIAAAYEAPFPEAKAKAGARAFPLMLPTEPQAPGAAAGREVRDALRADPRPKLVLWADSDPIIPFKVGERFAAALGADPPEKIERAGHFLQEDAGTELGRRIADWIHSNPV